MAAIAIRPATPRDAGDLICLFDMAARGLASYLWTQEAAPGQSPLEVARAMILGETPGINYRLAWMAEIAGDPAALLLGFRITEAVDPAARPPELLPIVELENSVVGHWLVNLLATYPQFRGRGVAARLLEFADEQARATGTDRLALVVDSVNTGARRVYERAGYRSVDSRPVVAFPGHESGGTFELMVKTLN